MTTQVLRPDQILSHDGQDLRNLLHEAVINAYMRKNTKGTGGLVGEDGSCDDGEFKFKYPIDLSGDRHFAVKYPSGEWREVITWSPDDDSINHGDTIDDLGGPKITVFDACSLWDSIKAAVDQWLDPWLDCQSPNVFTNQINSLANIAQQLYVGDEITFGGQGVTPVGGDNTMPSGTSAVSDVRSAIDEIKLDVDDLRGAAIDAFERSYVADIQRCIGGQHGLATAAGLAITAEAAGWNATYIAVQNLVLNAIHDFNDYAGSHSASGQGLATVLGAVGAVSGILGGTAGVAFPPFGIAMAVVGGAATIGGLMYPAQGEVKAMPITLSGGSYDEYWDSFKQKMKDINTDQKNAEQAISIGCRRMINDYKMYPDNYSLTKTTRRGRQGPDDDLKPFLASTIQFNETKMRHIAGAVESIGDHQRGLARILGGVDASGNPSALVADEWFRGVLPETGSMGSGYDGPYDDYADLVNLVVDLLVMEAKTSHSVAEKCIEIALDFNATDQQAETALNKETKQFDYIGIKQANVPPPPPPQHRAAPSGPNGLTGPGY